MTAREQTDVLVVGAGPAGSATAAWLARHGLDVLLTDAAVFPRDKTCGDGLTPRAIGELERLGLGDWLRAHAVNQRPACPRLRPDPAPALARRLPARLGECRRAHRARRPPAHHRDQVRRPCPRRRPRGRRTTRRRPGRAPSCSAVVTRPSRSAAGGSSSPTASGRRWASCSAASGTATRCTASPGAPTSPPRCPTTPGSAPTSSSGASRARCCPATAGSSPSAPAR